MWLVGVLVVAVVIAARLRPVSFSNPVAKVVCADGTALGGVWESRLLPPCFLVCVGCCLVRGGTPHTFKLRGKTHIIINLFNVHENFVRVAD